MKVFFVTSVLILSSCRSVELKQIVWYFWPLRIALGCDVLEIQRDLGVDTTKYSIDRIGPSDNPTLLKLKRYRLTRFDLDKLNLEDNCFDSIHLTFHKDKLFYIDLFASGNVNVEHLKLGIRGKKESGMSQGVTFRGTIGSEHRQLQYISRDGQMNYWYREDIVDNVAMLKIENRNMLMRMIHKRI